MKPQRFEIGQAVTPNKKKWEHVHDDVPMPPSFGNVYHVSEYWNFEDNLWYIHLKEVPDSYVYNEEGFDPVITTHELEKELSEIEITVAI